MSAAGVESNVIAPLATLVDELGAVDGLAMARQIASLHGRADAVMPAIGCGEGARLSNDQWHDLLSAVLSSHELYPVYMGALGRNWDVVRERAKAASRAKADGVVVGLPPNDRTSDREVGRLLAEIAVDVTDAATTFFYWESFLSGRAVAPDVVASWCDALGAAGVKDSMRDKVSTDRLRSRRPSLKIFEGWEDQLTPERRIDGYIGPLAILSDAPACLFGGGADWIRCRAEAVSMGLFDETYVKNVKRLLCKSGIASTDRLVDEVAA